MGFESDEGGNDVDLGAQSVLKCPEIAKGVLAQFGGNHYRLLCDEGGNCCPTCDEVGPEL